MTSAHCPRAAPKRVLVVEDVAAMRMFLSISLKRNDAEVAEAEGLRQARAHLRRDFNPDITLLDLELADGDGLDLVREIPENCLVFLLSADTSRETALRGRNAGCAGIINKQQDLGGFINGLFDRTKLHDYRASRVEDEIMARQYVEFLAESRVKLRNFLSACEFRSLRSIAHRLRGTAVHFGYTGLGAAAQRVSKALADGERRQLEDAVRDLCGQIGEALEAFQLNQSRSSNRGQSS